MKNSVYDFTFISNQCQTNVNKCANSPSNNNMKNSVYDFTFISIYRHSLLTLTSIHAENFFILSIYRDSHNACTIH